MNRRARWPVVIKLVPVMAPVVPPARPVLAFITYMDDIEVARRPGAAEYSYAATHLRLWLPEGSELVSLSDGQGTVPQELIRRIHGGIEIARLDLTPYHNRVPDFVAIVLASPHSEESLSGQSRADKWDELDRLLSA